jgi:transitional endoplasmic reticulum ATPase
METSSLAYKQLATMPREVAASTLAYRAGPLGMMFRIVKGIYDLCVYAATFCAPGVLFLWVDSFGSRARVIENRLAATATLLGLFVACIVSHLLELLGSVTWRDRAYPVLWHRSRIHDLLVSRESSGFALAPVTGTLAFLLWLTWLTHLQEGAGADNTLTHAVLISAMAVGMYLYGRFPPYFGLRQPNPQDRAWLADNGPARLLNATARPVAAPAPISQPTSQVSTSDYAIPVQLRTPRMTFADIFGMAQVKQRLLDPAQTILVPRAHGVEPPPNGILMHGAPGNGKTGFAEALAGELGVPMVTITYGDIASKWLGEMPRLIVNCFEYAKRHAPCVLFIDEVDSFLRSRDLGSSNAEDQKITNTLLTQLVEIRRHMVVVVAATNYLSTLDAASIREGRFDYKVEITPPDETARLGLLQLACSKYAANVSVDPEALASIARRWNGFSVSRLLAVGKELPKYARDAGKTSIHFEDWMAVLRLVQGRNGQPPAETKPLKDLILAPTTREALELITQRLQNARHIEARGGTLPSGILLHGPSGTGKTAAARALAVECGWAFLSVAGPDILAERDRLTKLYTQACDLRPALVFIDEADDVLRDRQLTTRPDIVNRMLSLMDGTDEKIKDVVFVAATNHPEQVDPALVRAGRFTEKVAFYLPGIEQSARAVSAWLDSKRVQVGRESDVPRVAELLAGHSIADIEGVLQYALNRAILRIPGNSIPVLRRDDLAAGIRFVSAQTCTGREQK